VNSLKTDDPALTAAMFLMALAVERCRERRNPNFSIELGEGIVRSTHSGSHKEEIKGLIKKTHAYFVNERYSEIVRKNIIPTLGAVLLTKLRPAQISEAYARALASGRRDGKGGLAPTTVVYMHRLWRRPRAGSCCRGTQPTRSTRRGLSEAP
jgi:hypothetical protein